MHFVSHMERAASLLIKLKSKNLPVEDLARAAWPAAVGKRLAERTRATHMVRQTLIVEVEDAMWRQQLNPLRFQILRNLTKVLGADSVAEIEFRIGVARRPPQRETIAAAPALSSADEAERIPDMALRRIYKQSRSKAVGA